MYYLKALLFALFLGIFSIPVLAGPIDINTADAKTFEKVNGIGPKTAAAIVTHRTKHGAFKSVDDLVRVKGIGPKSLEKIRANLTVGGGATLVKAANTGKTPEKAK